MNLERGSFRASAVPAAVVVGLLVSCGLTMHGTAAVFAAQTANPANTWAAGTVTLKDNDTDSALFTAPALLPNQSVSGCITVEYKGSLTAPVKLYASNSSGALQPYLDLTIEQAADNAQVTAGCAGFASGDTVYSGTLGDFATKTTYGTGVGGTWTPGADPTYKAYRFTVRLQPSTPDTLQGEAAGVTFTWEAQAGT